MRKFTTAILMWLLVRGCAEYLPISSGALEGRVQPLPAALDRITQDKIIQLETSASEAYSVNLWVVDVIGYLHVFAGDNKATWVEHIEQNRYVRLRSGDEIFEPPTAAACSVGRSTSGSSCLLAESMVCRQTCAPEEGSCSRGRLTRPIDDP